MPATGTSIRGRSLRVSLRRPPRVGVSLHIFYVSESHGMLTKSDLCRCWCDGLAGDSVLICVLGRIDTQVFVRQYPDVNSSWITTVRGNTWPVPGSPSPTTTTISTASPTSTRISGSCNCAGVSAWSSSVAVRPAQLHPCTHCAHYISF